MAQPIELKFFMKKLLKKCRQMSPFPLLTLNLKKSYDVLKIRKIQSFWPNAFICIPFEKVISTKSLP